MSVECSGTPGKRNLGSFIYRLSRYCPDNSYALRDFDDDCEIKMKVDDNLVKLTEHV